MRVGEEVQGLRTGPKTFNHFWPRLWLTAKPLGAEARKGALPGVSQSVEESVDSRIFVQGGPWIAEHVHLLTIPEGVILPQRATCVLFMKGSELYNRFCPDDHDDELIQGVLESVSKERSQCVLYVYADEKRSSDSLNLDGPQTRVNTALTNPDIWWCIPYWVAADYKLHLEKIPVGRGYYFLVEPGQKFCIVSLNWAYEDVFVEAKVDGKQCSKYSWLLESPNPSDVQPVLFDMFESEEAEGAVLKGELLTFTRRQTSEQPSKGWQEEVALCGAVVVRIYKAAAAEEGGVGTASGESETSSDDESTSSVEDSSRGTAKIAAHTQQSGRAISAAVKQDSKWAVHLSVASAPGEKAEATGNWFDCSAKVGRRLGSNVLHYRGPEWFQPIDLMLQEERMRASRMKKNASIIVGESSPEGVTKDTAICLEDSPPQSSPAPAARTQGGPIRKSKTFMVRYHEGGKDNPAKHVVRVPKTHSAATFKSMVKDVLADEDLVGEGVRTTKMRWTYIESDGCEVDISSSTEASDLESSSAFHVYAPLK